MRRWENEKSRHIVIIIYLFIHEFSLPLPPYPSFRKKIMQLNFKAQRFSCDAKDPFITAECWQNWKQLKVAELWILERLSFDSWRGLSLCLWWETCQIGTQTKSTNEKSFFPFTRAKSLVVLDYWVEAMIPGTEVQVKRRASRSSAINPLYRRSWPLGPGTTRASLRVRQKLLRNDLLQTHRPYNTMFNSTTFLAKSCFARTHTYTHKCTHEIFSK